MAGSAWRSRRQAASGIGSEEEYGGARVQVVGLGIIGLYSSFAF
jgi:hypothetical protein